MAQDKLVRLIRDKSPEGRQMTGCYTCRDYINQRMTKKKQTDLSIDEKEEEESEPISEEQCQHDYAKFWQITSQDLNSQRFI